MDLALCGIYPLVTWMYIQDGGEVVVNGFIPLCEAVTVCVLFH